MKGDVAKERGFMPTLRWLGQRLLSLPTAAVVALFGGWSYLIYEALTFPSRDLDGINHFKDWVNNLGHAFLFGLWVLWMLPLLPRRGGWAALGKGAWTALLAVTLAGGAATECLQSRLPSRSASWADVVTDVVGAACVLWIAGYLGEAEASEEGTRSRLLRALLACCAAALLATLTL